METVTPAAVPSTPKKSKASKPKSANKVSAHPSYQDMIKNAVEALKERNGSSRQAIQKYIQSTFKTCDDKVSQAHLKMALKRGVELGLLKRVKGTGASGSFRMAQKVAKPVKPKVAKKPVAKKTAAAVKPAVKKAAAPKPKTSAVKPKTSAAKPKKKAVAEKKASKPKVAKKPKTPKKAVKPAAKKPATPKAKKPAAKKAPAKK